MFEIWFFFFAAMFVIVLFPKIKSNMDYTFPYFFHLLSFQYYYILYLNIQTRTIKLLFLVILNQKCVICNCYAILCYLDQEWPSINIYLLIYPENKGYKNYSWQNKTRIHIDKLFKRCEGGNLTNTVWTLLRTWICFFLLKKEITDAAVLFGKNRISFSLSLKYLLDQERYNKKIKNSHYSNLLYVQII